MFGSHSFCDPRASSFGESYYRGLAARQIVERVILFTISDARLFFEKQHAERRKAT